MMDKIISLLRTPEECMDLAEIFSELAVKARRRAMELRASAHGINSEIENVLWQVIYAYEEVLTKRNNRRTRAQRTRNMISRYGIVNAAERAVNRRTDAMGYQVLVQMGLQDLTFEAVIVRYPQEFQPEIVKLAQSRLNELKKSL